MEVIVILALICWYIIGGSDWTGGGGYKRRR